MTSGTPRLDNTHFVSITTVWPVDWQLHMSRYSAPFHDNKSVTTTCHSLVGTSCGFSVSLACVFWLSWQISHFCTLVSMSLLSFGQKNALMTLLVAGILLNNLVCLMILSTMWLHCNSEMTSLSSLRTWSFPILLKAHFDWPNSFAAGLELDCFSSSNTSA